MSRCHACKYFFIRIVPVNYTNHGFKLPSNFYLNQSENEEENEFIFC